jgi:hypothetical protein
MPNISFSLVLVQVTISLYKDDSQCPNGKLSSFDVIAHIQMEHLSMMFSIGYPWLQGTPPISIDVSNKSHMGPTMWFLWFLNTSHQKKEKRAFPKSSSSKCGHRE